MNKPDNRDWITKQNIYDFLCFINEQRNCRYCVVSKCEQEIDRTRCFKYNSCNLKPNTDQCQRYACGEHCNRFQPNCKQCIADYLNEEDKNKCSHLFY